MCARRILNLTHLVVVNDLWRVVSQNNYLKCYVRESPELLLFMIEDSLRIFSEESKNEWKKSAHVDS